MNALILGVLGMLCIVIAFILDEFVASFNQNTLRYNLLNIAGSALLLYYGITIRGWPFVILNAIWLVAAGIKIMKLEQK